MRSKKYNTKVGEQRLKKNVKPPEWITIKIKRAESMKERDDEEKHEIKSKNKKSKIYENEEE